MRRRPPPRPRLPSPSSSSEPMDPPTPAPPCIARPRSPWRWTQVRVVAARRTTENRDELQAALDDTARRLAWQGLDVRTELVEGDHVSALLDVAAAECACL